MKHLKRCSSLFALMLFVLLLLTACGADGDASGNEKEDPGIAFPYELADGKLTVNSLFPSSIENPDFGNAYGDDIASIEILNSSEEFLYEASVTVHLADGTDIPFTITNLPAGQTVWAFATDNTSIAAEAVCTDIDCSTQFSPEAPLMADQVSFEVQETEVTLHNLTSADLTDLSVGCHCQFDGVYFGGITYSYPVDTLSADGSIVCNAEDCYLDCAAVVSITSNQS